MNKELQDKINNSIHRDIYYMMAEMEKTGMNYLFNIEFLVEANEMMASPDFKGPREPVSFEIVSAIFAPVVKQIEVMK